MSEWDLGAVTLLGAFHGVNPAMGWLFAVAIGLQERARKALLLALVPIAIGHEASIGVTVLLIEELRLLASEQAIRIAGASLLALLAAWRIARSHRHPRWVGMRLRRRELALWSFLMSSAHGAGLMLFPFALGSGLDGHRHELVSAGLSVAVVAAVLHTLAMVVVAGATALFVYDVVGVGILRRGWLNLDRVWAYALVASAAATLFIA